jgi:hypothetical protein
VAGTYALTVTASSGSLKNTVSVTWWYLIINLQRAQPARRAVVTYRRPSVSDRRRPNTQRRRYDRPGFGWLPSRLIVSANARPGEPIACHQSFSMSC